MAVKINPLSDRVVAQAEEAKTRTASGIYLPEAAQEKSKAAKVVAVGPDAKGISVGDMILYEEFAATEVKVDGDDYLIVKADKILATVK